MTQKEFKQKLREIQKPIFDAAQQIWMDADFVNKGLALEFMTMHKTILNKTGYSERFHGKKALESKKAPSKGFFKKANVTIENTPDVKPIENKGVKKAAFKRNDTPNTDANEIVNKNVNNSILKKSADMEVTEAEGKREPKHMNKKDKDAIIELAEQGLNLKQISDKVNIVEKKVLGVLKQMKKGASKNLITTSNSKSKFKKEIDEYNDNK